MTQEEKTLLLKVLCEMLPYGVKYETYIGDVFTLVELLIVGNEYAVNNGSYFIYEIKPYLRPMSSMTDEENIEYNEICLFNGASIALMSNVISSYETIDWLNAHHFDYRDLIPMGLALEAPEGMYKF